MLDGIVGSMDNVERFVENALGDCGNDPEVRALALDVKALVRVGMLVGGVPEAMAWATLTRAELAKVGGRHKRSADELTPAELTTARLAADGLSNKDIARRTGVSINTVEAHLTRAYGKLGVRSCSQLAARLPARSSPQ